MDVRIFPEPAPLSRRKFLQFSALTLVDVLAADFFHGVSLGSNGESVLEDLQRRQLQYFLDNQLPSGLILDRQRNHGAVDFNGLASTSATGMGLVAIALASMLPYRMLSRSDAIRKVELAISTALHRLPQDHGIMPHFLNADLEPTGEDQFSTIDSSWLIAGALTASQMLADKQIITLAKALYDRVDWRYWAEGTAGKNLLQMGETKTDSFLPTCWDRLDAETAFMYLLASSARPPVALDSQVWQRLVPTSRDEWQDLGLFVAQYSNCLVDPLRLQSVAGLNLLSVQREQTQNNFDACKVLSPSFLTFKDFWGLSAGDGPGVDGDVYRTYSPMHVDGTAHVTATLASIAVCPDIVIANVVRAINHRLKPLGKYGLSNINVDRNWISRDVIGIDLGASIMALDNFLHGNRIRTTFSQSPCVIRTAS
jgi:hypothetical protein